MIGLVNPSRFKLVGELGILDIGAVPINPDTGVPWAAGDKYRLMFSSSTLRDALSKTIADYDTHVQDAADAASQELGSGWKALVCCPTAAAADFEVDEFDNSPRLIILEAGEGDQTSVFVAGVKLLIAGANDAGNNQGFTVVSSAFTGGRTEITVSEVVAIEAAGDPAQLWLVTNADEHAGAEDGVDTDGPVFMTDGSSKIADDLADFWDNAHSSFESNVTDEDGAKNGDYVTTGSWASWEPNWTGSGSDGESVNPVGGDVVTLGLCSGAASAGQWINRSNNDPNPTENKRVYAMSPVLTVRSANN